MHINFKFSKEKYVNTHLTYPLFFVTPCSVLKKNVIAYKGDGAVVYISIVTPIFVYHNIVLYRYCSGITQWQITTFGKGIGKIGR